MIAVSYTHLDVYKRQYQTNRYDMDFSKATKDNVTYQHYKNLLSIRNAYTDVFRCV